MERDDRKPAAELGLLDATMIGMGAMIGAGIFVLTGLPAESAGPAALFVFVLIGVVTAFTGLSYAELTSAIPKSGGGYAFMREVFADLASFLMRWMLWFPYMIGGALYALGFAPNFHGFLRVYGYVPPPDQVGAVALPVVEAAVPASVELSVDPRDPAANRDLHDMAFPSGSDVVADMETMAIAGPSTELQPDRRYLLAVKPTAADTVRNRFQGVR